MNIGSLSSVADAFVWGLAAVAFLVPLALGILLLVHLAWAFVLCRNDYDAALAALARQAGPRFPSRPQRN
ncbi:hypothetical protein GCM10007301_30960 [Azorhizobium oxalatiphilum]|uniref:Uncharacterized protein n=1 Tax=Azorhizobium oxalatiphilum TaxID=980631 RepID=A0A917C2H1_9HYPH|nr:hypothetical protein [Azorhizobium oxalatiphilum]GGF69084.1 hypothetical protein GCM10007301_30960 [Azorhizobium oxalatiphilum]